MMNPLFCKRRAKIAPGIQSKSLSKISCGLRAAGHKLTDLLKIGSQWALSSCVDGVYRKGVVEKMYFRLSKKNRKLTRRARRRMS